LGNAAADVALGLRDVKAGNELASEIEKLGRRALPLQMDVAHLDQISRAVDDTFKRFGRLDILVNNAGGGVSNLAEDVSEREFDETVAINLKATFFASQAAGRVMVRQEHVRIINLSSQSGLVALPTESVYCMTMAGVSQ